MKFSEEIYFGILTILENRKNKFKSAMVMTGLMSLICSGIIGALIDYDIKNNTILMSLTFITLISSIILLFVLIIIESEQEKKIRQFKKITEEGTELKVIKEKFDL